MKTISLKIDDAIFDDTENILENIKKPRNRYINEAIEYYNKVQNRILLQKKMHNATNILILNLAIAEIVFIIICVPFTGLNYVLR